MIVEYRPETGARLIEADDFKNFKLRIVHAPGVRPKIDGVFFIDDVNVLIGIDTVRTLPGAPQEPEWHASYLAMISYAKSKGWIDPERNAIRAHVERIP